MVSKIMVNDLLKKLGYGNILVTDKPVFYWNGNNITYDETSPVKRVSDLKLNEKLNFLDFLKNNSDKKIVLMSHPDGKLINDDNIIRVFVD